MLKIYGGRGFTKTKPASNSFCHSIQATFCWFCPKKANARSLFESQGVSIHVQRTFRLEGHERTTDKTRVWRHAFQNIRQPCPIHSRPAMRTASSNANNMYRVQNNWISYARLSSRRKITMVFVQCDNFSDSPTTQVHEIVAASEWTPIQFLCLIKVRGQANSSVAKCLQRRKIMPFIDKTTKCTSISMTELFRGYLL